MNLNKGNDPNAAFQQYSIHQHHQACRRFGRSATVQIEKTCPNPGASVVVVLWAPLPCYGWENNSAKNVCSLFSKLLLDTSLVG